jgi:MFS family permease
LGNFYIRSKKLLVMNPSSVSGSGEPHSASIGDLAKVTTVASIGSLIEFFDLFIGGLAASIAWPTLFFPEIAPGLGVAASYSTLAVTYLVRPLGGFVFGHVGDRRGRKSVLVWTLVLTGVGIGGVALVPSYAAIGLLAPIVVIILRACQGLGLGGEWGGAATWVAEFAAKSKWRTFWTSWIQAVAIIGSSLASLAFAIVGAGMSHADLVSYGWRIVFGIGALVVLVGALVRYATRESPLFEQLKQKKAIVKLPAVTVFKERGGALLLLAVASIPTLGVVNIVISPFTISWLTALNVNPVVVAEDIAIAGAVATLTHIVGGIIGSITGRKRLILLISSLTYIVLLYPYYIWIGSRNLTLILVAIVLFEALPRPGAGVLPAILTDYFLTKYRASGSGQAYQIGTLIVGVIVGFVLPALVIAFKGPAGAAPYVLGVYGICSAASLAVAAIYLRDVEELPA